MRRRSRRLSVFPLCIVRPCVFNFENPQSLWISITYKSLGLHHAMADWEYMLLWLDCFVRILGIYLWPQLINKGVGVLKNVFWKESVVVLSYWLRRQLLGVFLKKLVDFTVKFLSRERLTEWWDTIRVSLSFKQVDVIKLRVSLSPYICIIHVLCISQNYWSSTVIRYLSCISMFTYLILLYFLIFPTTRNLISTFYTNQSITFLVWRTQ